MNEIGPYILIGVGILGFIFIAGLSLWRDFTIIRINRCHHEFTRCSKCGLDRSELE